MVLQQILTTCRRLTVSLRTNATARRSACLAAIPLEERAVPAVADGFAPPIAAPGTVQFALLSHEPTVRADLFSVGGAATQVQHTDDTAWLASLAEPGHGGDAYQELLQSETEMDLDLALASASD